MTWIIAIGILLFLGLMYPHFGKVALMGVGAVILLIVVAFWWIYVSSSNEQKAAESLISPAQLELINLQLFRPSSGGYGYVTSSGYNLTGEIKNNSSHTLTSANVAISAYDCPSDTIDAQCETIGESDVYLSITVPPHQRRSITNETAYFNDMPSIKGNFLWSYEITETRAIES